jgi:hypothetical protein
VVALDLAGIPEKSVQRIPLASWFRFQRAVEHTKTVLLVISEFRCAESCAALILKFGGKSSARCPTLVSPSFEEWVSPDQISASPAHTQILEKMRVETELVRSRLERKPAQSVKAGFTTRAIRVG